MKQEAKFSDWWRRVAPGVRRSVSSIAGSESPDILQDVSVMAIQRFKEFRSYDAFERWVHIRARWLALDELSRRRVFVEYPDSVDSVPASPVDPRIEEIRRIILYLPTQQQRVALDRLQGYTSEEISARLSIAPSTVRSIWRNAKQKIIEMMRDD